MDLFTTLLAQLSQARIVWVTPKKPRPKVATKKVLKPCRRCPPEKKRTELRRSKTGLCRHCRIHFSSLAKKQREERPDEPELTVDEFIRLHPSHYARVEKAKPSCLRCPSKLKRLAKSSVLELCASCEATFYAVRRRLQVKFPKAPKLTVPEFIRLYPRVLKE